MRKLISIVLALVMALSLCVTTTWADDVTVVNDLAGLQAAITAKKPNIKLGADIVIDPTTVPYWNDGWKETHPVFVIDYTLTFDMDGHKISYKQDPYTPVWEEANPNPDDTRTTSFYMFILVAGADMTVTGNGTIDASMVVSSDYRAETHDGYLTTFCFRLHNNAGANLNIKNGSFMINTPSNENDDSSHNVVYVKDGGGTVTIDGGHFEVKGTPGIVLNVQGNNYDGTQPKHIYMNGGTIVGRLGNIGKVDNEITPNEALAQKDGKDVYYAGSDAIADAVNKGENVTVKVGGEINGVKGGSIKVANGVTGVKINGVPVETSGETNDPTTIELWTVSFMDGDTVLNKVGIVKGSQQPVERPADPTKAGCIFVRWNDVEGEEYDFDAIVDSDLTLVAEWELAPHEHTRRQPTTTTTTEVTPDTTTTDVVTSAKTFDAGIAVYGVMAVLSVTGSAWVVGKKRG